MSCARVSMASMSFTRRQGYRIWGYQFSNGFRRVRLDLESKIRRLDIKSCWGSNLSGADYLKRGQSVETSENGVAWISATQSLIFYILTEFKYSFILNIWICLDLLYNHFKLIIIICKILNSIFLLLVNSFVLVLRSCAIFFQAQKNPFSNKTSTCKSRGWEF